MSSKGQTISPASIKNQSNVPLISISPEQGLVTGETVAMRIDLRNARVLLKCLATLCAEDTIATHDGREFSGDLVLTAKYNHGSPVVGLLRWSEYKKQNA